MLVVHEHHGDRLKHQVPHIGMMEFDGQLSLVLDLVERPPVTKFCAHLLQALNQGREPGIIEVLPALHAKQNQQGAGFPFSVHHEKTNLGMGEMMPDNVALHGWIDFPITQTA